MEKVTLSNFKTRFWRVLQPPTACLLQDAGSWNPATKLWGSPNQLCGEAHVERRNWRETEAQPWLREPSDDPAPSFQVSQLWSQIRKSSVMAVALCLNSWCTASASTINCCFMALSLGAFCLAVIATGAARKWWSQVGNLEFQALSTHFQPAPSCYLGKPQYNQQLAASSLPAWGPLTSPFYLEKKTPESKENCFCLLVTAVVLFTM